MSNIVKVQAELELQPIGNENNTVSDTESVVSDDEKILLRMGYKSELYRGLGAFSNFAFGFTEVSVLCSFVSMYSYGLTTGGSAAIVWGFLITYFFNTIVAYSMAEICSAYPSAGSVYHWTGQLVPPHLTPIASYICGWTNFLGNGAGDAAFAYSWATFLSAAVVMSGGATITSQDLVAISILILLVWSGLNFFRIDKVGMFNNMAVIAHMGTIGLMFFALFAGSKKLQSAEWVFTSYNNETGFNNQGYVLVMGLLTSVYCFSGFEASAHMAEETHGSRTNAPNGLINTVLATGIGGLLILFPLLFATTDINNVLNNGLSGNAAVDAVSFALGDKWAAAYAWLVTINLFFAGVSSVAVTGRITWALMRDRGFLYSEYFAQVDPALQSPVRAIMFVFTFDAVLLLLPLNPGVGLTAFYSIVGLCAVGFNGMLLS